MNPIILTTVTAFLTLVTAALSLGASLRNRRKLDALTPKVEAVGPALQEIHVTMNSRLDELLRITREAAHAAGVAEGTQIERDRKVPE